MNLPDDYITGNAKMDEKIAIALNKEKPNRLTVINLTELPSRVKPNIYSTEHDECVLLKDWLDQLLWGGKIKNYTHVPNETYTESHTQKRKNKQEGVKSGFPDYVILTQKCLIVVEMKRVKGGEVSETQKVWLAHFTELGIPNIVANGFDEAKDFIKKYL